MHLLFASLSENYSLLFITIHYSYKGPSILPPQTQKSMETFCIMFPVLGLLQNSMSKNITFLLE